MLRLVLITALLSVGGVPSEALACSCDVPPTPKAIEMADLIVTGRVVKMEWNATTGVIQTEINVSETLSGSPPGLPLRVYHAGPGGPCLGFGFIPGRDYIIFASRYERWIRAGDDLKAALNDYVIYSCGGTIELHNAAGNRRLEETRKSVALKRQ
jgi:hypothetical protein